jgi:hypothetical protein
MEMVLEMVEVDVLLRKALEKEGVKVPDEARMIYRPNHKKQTFRIVFTTRDTRRPRRARTPT